MNENGNSGKTYIFNGKDALNVSRTSLFHVREKRIMSNKFDSPVLQRHLR